MQCQSQCLHLLRSSHSAMMLVNILQLNECMTCAKIRPCAHICTMSVQQLFPDNALRRHLSTATSLLWCLLLSSNSWYIRFGCKVQCMPCLKFELTWTTVHICTGHQFDAKSYEHLFQSILLKDRAEGSVACSDTTLQLMAVTKEHFSLICASELMHDTSTPLIHAMKCSSELQRKKHCTGSTLTANRGTWHCAIARKADVHCT